MSVDYVKAIVRAALPFLGERDDLDRAISRFFGICFAITALFAIIYIAVAAVAGHPEINWLAFSMGLWFPVGYAMQATLRDLQDGVEARSPSWFSPKITAYGFAALAGVYAMKQICDAEQISLAQISMVPLLAYGIGMWNTMVLTAMLNWRMFDKGSVAVIILGFLFGYVWHTVENE